MFQSITISLFAKALQIENDNLTHIQNVAIDSRKVQAGDVFFALKGSFDEVLAYSKQAFANGAILIVSSYQLDNTTNQADICRSEHPARPPFDTLQNSCDYFCVDNPEQALQTLAKLNRSFFDGTMIALTGSNGKTTVKNLIANGLNALYPNQMLATVGNLNNHLGVPLSLCNLNENHKFAVLEIGANHLGEIEFLAQLVQPQLALITSLSNAHLGEFGTFDNIKKAKTEIIEALPNNGTFFLSQNLLKNNFDEIYQKALLHLKNVIISENILKIQTAHLQNNHYKITLSYQNNDYNFDFPLLGQHNINNLLLALSVIFFLDNQNIDKILNSYQTFANNSGRGQIYTLPNNVTLIDESYNANPSSVKALINTLTNFTPKKILILGEMKELGEHSIQMHQDIGTFANGKIDNIWTFGQITATIKKTFTQTTHFETLEALQMALLQEQNAVIAVKGSRSNQLDIIIKKTIGV
jgi:UDP-N-acetylmuramoyl-tripeptide--D-alanyl-D-alanine ligase